MGIFIRFTYVKILDPNKNRTKYDLVYLTRHPLGIKVFMEASEKLDLVQQSIRAQVKQNKQIDKTGQMELISADFGIIDNDQTDLTIVKNYWLNKLSEEPKQFGYEELADMLEDTAKNESRFVK